MNLVCLHGFTGTQSTWHELADLLPNVHVIVFDLFGHGSSQVENCYTMDEQIDAIDRVLAGFDEFALLGYSMGGRTALSYAAKYPSKVTHLLLESASPGLKRASERAERRSRDEALACKIETEGIEAFVDFWQEIPLFATQRDLPVEVQQIIREERLSQTEKGLALSLRSVGTGAQASQWHNLKNLPMPVTLITGALDQKFCAIAQDMAECIPKVKHIVVNGAGHAIHVENPAEFATIVKEQLKTNLGG